MLRLLFPGRHHLLTNYQLQYLTLVTSGDAAALPDVDGKPLGLTGRFEAVFWAITSANHADTRRNPLPGHHREVAVEEFAAQLDVPSYIYLIDDVGHSEHFASYVLKKIEVDSQGRWRLTPADTVVACSTPEVMEQYERLGFRILPVELSDRRTPAFEADPPWHLLERFIEAGLRGEDWRTHPLFLTRVARASRRLYLKYEYGDRILELHRHPLLTEDGDLTGTRDYNVYVRAFDEGADRKYDLIKDLVVPGRIVDVGCCTGSLIRRLTQDDRLRESDFYGIEAARKLFVECQHRKEQGAFGVDNVFFYQRNVAAGPIFPAHSVNSFLTFSLTHELESYQGRTFLERFIGLVFEQLTLGGRWLNVDVVGPEDKDDTVYLWLNRKDGRDDDRAVHPEEWERQRCTEYLQGLSTYGRFMRFAADFRRREGYRLEYIEEIVAEMPYIGLRLQDACEFLSKKDYIDNWYSEMHETFCFWSFREWKEAVERAGFTVLPASRAFVNPWIVENRYKGKAALFRVCAGVLTPMEYPVTNMVLAAERR
jgi:hypothetical protein